MFDFYEKRKLRGVIFSKPIAAIVFVIALLMSHSAYGRYIAEQETSEKRIERQLELEGLKMRASALESKVERLESERGIEDAIREQFDVAKQNEEVIVIVDENAGKKAEVQRVILPLPQKPSLLERLKFW